MVSQRVVRGNWGVGLTNKTQHPIEQSY